MPAHSIASVPKLRVAFIPLQSWSVAHKARSNTISAKSIRVRCGVVRSTTDFTTRANIDPRTPTLFVVLVLIFVQLAALITKCQMMIMPLLLFLAFELHREIMPGVN
jgi:hypothetical protein